MSWPKRGSLKKAAAQIAAMYGSSCGVARRTGILTETFRFIKDTKRYEDVHREKVRSMRDYTKLGAFRQASACGTARSLRNSP